MLRLTLATLLGLAVPPADASPDYTVTLTLYQHITAADIARAHEALEVAAQDDTILGDIVIDCVGTIDCYASTTRLGELDVISSEWVSTRQGDGIEIEYRSNGGSHWLWIEPNPSP